MIVAKSDHIAVRCIAESCQGGRPENQDDLGFLDTPFGFLCIVCDGMGGGPGGKTASYIAKYEISSALALCNSMTPRENAFKMAVAKAQSALDEKMNSVPELRGMGSTFVAVLINKQSAIVAHAGDSRCYQIRGKKCIYRSTDHSLVAELIKRKVLTEEEARVSPQSNVVSRGLGCTTNHVPEIEEVTFRKGDKFILCTDGVWGAMPNKDLLLRFTQYDNIQQVVSSLSKEVDQVGFSKGGGHDNHTLAIIEMLEDGNSKKRIDFKKYALVTLAVLLVSLMAWAICLLYNNGNNANETSLLSNVSYPNSNNRPSCSDSVTGTRSDSILEKRLDSLGFAKKDSLRKDSLQATTENVDSTKTDSTSMLNGPHLTPKDAKDAVTKIQQIINRLDSLKAISEKQLNNAQSNAMTYKREVGGFVQELENMTKGTIEHYGVLRIKSMLLEEKIWYISKDKIKGKHVAVSKKEIDDIIEELRKFKKNIKV